jgi:hypothetical protein
MDLGLNMLRNVLVFMSVLITSCTQNNVEFNIPDGFCGAVYIIHSRSADSNSVRVDSLGIGYVHNVRFLKGYRFRVIRNGQDITDNCRENSSGTSHLSDSIEISYMKFFVPCEGEIDRDDEFWRRKSAMATHRFLELFDQGLIKVER